MPFRTEHGTHYHMTSGCCNATIPCDVTGLAPCSICCGTGNADSEPMGLASHGSTISENDTLEPTDGPAVFTQEFTTPESDGVYAVRISRDSTEGQESVISKGTEVGRVPTPEWQDEESHMKRLSSLLDMTSSADMMGSHGMPEVTGIQADDLRSIYFDMDGTLADLYSVPDWLPRLRSKDPTPYEDAPPLVDMGELNDAIQRLQRAGWHVGVVSWLSKVSDDRYSRAVSASKRLWLMRNLPTIDEINLVSYGVAKQTAVANKRNAILVDDEPQNLDAWHDAASGRTTINASVPSEMLRRVRELSFAS